MDFGRRHGFGEQLDKLIFVELKFGVIDIFEDCFYDSLVSESGKVADFEGNFGFALFFQLLDGLID